MWPCLFSNKLGKKECLLGINETFLEYWTKIDKNTSTVNKFRCCLTLALFENNTLENRYSLVESYSSNLSYRCSCIHGWSKMYQLLVCNKKQNLLKLFDERSALGLILPTKISRIWIQFLIFWKIQGRYFFSFLTLYLKLFVPLH